MPTISIFFGVIVQMYWNDHPPPHVHVYYAGFEALFAIESGAVIGRPLPPKVERLVRDWMLARRGELMENCGARAEWPAVPESPGSRRVKFQIVKVLEVASAG